MNCEVAIENIVYNYKGKHDKCHLESRCRIDPYYEPTKMTLKSEVAETLLVNILHKMERI